LGNLLWDAVLFSFGTDALWKKKNTGEEITLQGVFYSRPLEAKLGSEFTLYGTTPRFVVPYSANFPQIDDTLHIDSETYKVSSFLSQPDIQSISLELKKNRAP
jgi:hypothetical protein